jgi:hypothetical protein
MPRKNYSNLAILESSFYIFGYTLKTKCMVILTFGGGGGAHFWQNLQNNFTFKKKLI